jgi:hypothetical protein
MVGRICPLPLVGIGLRSHRLPLLVLQMLELLDVVQPIIRQQTSQDFKAVMSLFEKIAEGQTFGHILITLLRILYLCHFGSTNFVLPIRPKYGILNRVIRVWVYNCTSVPQKELKGSRLMHNGQPALQE